MSYTKEERFTLTETHVRLIRSLVIDWEGDDIWGAPVIDGKRPYGNSDIPKDVAEVLGITKDSEEDWTDAQLNQIADLHTSMETALQVVLSAGSFEPGEYKSELYSRSWYRVR